MKELLSHSIPSGDDVEVLARCLDMAIAALEKRKFGVGSRASTSSKASKPGSRHVPFAVRRAVLARDGHQCSYRSASGKRCSARKLLEFHHTGREFARGGEATLDNLALRCRAHNQYEAEQSYGARFMEEKREAARRARAATGAATRSVEVHRPAPDASRAHTSSA